MYIYMYGIFIGKQGSNVLYINLCRMKLLMRIKHLILFATCSFLFGCSGTPDPEDFQADAKIFGPEVNQPINLNMVYKFDLEPKQKVTIKCNVDPSFENAIIVYWTNEKGSNLPVALNCTSTPG